MKHTIQNILAILALTFMAGSALAADKPNIVLINMLTFQPFVNYNIKNGLYLTFSPIITANWEASSGQKWTVPIGGGVGKIFKIGSQAINAQASYYHNLEKPDITGDWSIRLQLQFMFPK